MTDIYHVTIAAVTKAAKKSPEAITIRAPGTNDHWTWAEGWKGPKGEPPEHVEVPDTHWSPPAKDLPKRPAPAKDVVTETEKIMAWWRKLYENGILASSQADTLAAQTALVDREGNVWTVGIATGAWYRFDKTWKATDAPGPETIVAIEEAIADEDEAVIQGLASFYREAKGPGPERVTEPWAHDD